ncbi:MAG: PQQ-binding-like beta-propeller repeat protein [candidate division Zixibacteria bacterium]|nr:PQQ-binding-like beta-propeller repeat protein [candidate division Zixibacteria bacterium]
MFASPAVAGNLLFIGSCSGICYALDKNTGEEVWTYDAQGKSFHGDPILTDDLLIIPTDDSYYEGSVGPLLAIQRSSGELQWRYDITSKTQLGCGVTTDLRFHEGRILGVTTTDQLICLDSQTGKLLWEFVGEFDPETNYWNSSPAILDTLVFFGCLNGKAYCFNIVNGEILWTNDLGSRVSASVVIADNNVCFGTVDGNIHTLSPASGETISQLPLDGIPVFKMTARGNSLLVLTADDQFSPGASAILSVDVVLDSVTWRLSSSADTPWSIKKPYLYKNYVIAGDGDGVVSLIDAESGEIEWDFAVEGEVRSVGVTEDVLYIGTIQGMVYAVRVNF